MSKSEMDKYWKHLSLLYMTEESDDPNNPNGIIEHKLQCRSKSMLFVFARTIELDKFISVLDS